MLRVVFGVFILSIVSLSVRPSLSQDSCSDVLKNGFMNKTTVSEGSNAFNDFNSWLCSTEFHTHQEAMDAGISLGVPVYGVPLQLGGQFDKSARDSWKKASCTSTTDVSQYSARYDKVVEEISGPVVAAWRDCMLAQFSTRIGLTGVAITHGAQIVTFKVRWTPYDQFDTRLPKVIGYSLVGATVATIGQNLLKVGNTVPATETNIDLMRQSVNTPVVVTLNTDRGSVPAYVPPQTMRLRVTASLTPKIDQRSFQTHDADFYQVDPSDDCVKDMSGSENYYPPDGFTFSSYTYEETTKNGDRTSYSWGAPTDNRVAMSWHVQGDDGLGGFCKRRGWLGIKVHVTGDKWAPKDMTKFDTHVEGGPLQESIVITYPYLQPSADVKNFTLPFNATVDKIVGDDISTVQLTPGVSAGGISTSTDSLGNLVINASQAFADWRNQSHAIGAASSGPSTRGLHVNEEASKQCAAADSGSVVYSMREGKGQGQYEVTCGPNPHDLTKRGLVQTQMKVMTIK